MQKVFVKLADYHATLRALARDGKYSLDTETTGLRGYHNDKLFSIIIADAEAAYYFDFNGTLPRSLLPLFQPVFDNPNSLWFIHNAKFDLMMLAREELFIKGTVHCTEAIGRVHRNNRLRYGLAFLASEIGESKSDKVMEYIKANDLYRVENGERIPEFNRVPLDIIFEYACQDAIACRKLGLYQEEKIYGTETNGKPLSVVMENERKLTPVLFKMERNGIKIDRGYVEAARDYERDRMKKARTEFEEITGKEFTDSAKVLAPIFDSMGEFYPRTPKGNPSFKADSLEGMTTPIAKLIIDFRDAQKKCNTYYENYLYYADKNGYIHANCRQGGTGTGRVSYSDPNLQNVNKESDTTNPWLVRRSFIPSVGTFFLCPDYDQMEYRKMLEYAKQMDLIEAVKGGLDVHEATAQMMGVPRNSAKTINFMLLYGGGIAKLCMALFKPTLPHEILLAIGRIYIYEMRSYPDYPHHMQLVSAIPNGVLQANIAELVKAHELLEKYFERLPAVKTFIRNVQKVAKDRGHIVNWLGRRSYFGPGVPTHKAPNYLIQGGCADDVKIAMVRVGALLEGKKSRMLLQVHDELLFEIFYGEEYLIPLIKEIMEGAYPYKYLPLTVGVDYATKSWADKIPYGEKAA